MIFCIGKIKENEERERTSTTVRTGKKANANRLLDYDKRLDKCSREVT